MRPLRVLICCEFSGKLREAFRVLGHDAWSCDLLPAEDGSPFHIQADALHILNGYGVPYAGSPVLKKDSPPWDLIGLHYTCTFFCNSGVQWLYLPRADGNSGRSSERDPVRWEKMLSAAKEFAVLWGAAKATGAKVYFENPQMHSHAQIALDRFIPNWSIKPSQWIQPFDYGHPETKKTGLWLHGLPCLTPTKIVRNEMAALPKAQSSRVHYASPKADRWKERSRTLSGIAQAMASQWSTYLSR